MRRGRPIDLEGGQGSAEGNEPRVVSFQAGGERGFSLSEGVERLGELAFGLD